MTKINTVANNGLTIVENYNKLLEQFRKTKTIMNGCRIIQIKQRLRD